MPSIQAVLPYSNKHARENRITLVMNIVGMNNFQLSTNKEFLNEKCQDDSCVAVSGGCPPGVVVNFSCSVAAASESPVGCRARYIAGRRGRTDGLLTSLPESTLSAGTSGSFSDSWLHLIFSPSGPLELLDRKCRIPPLVKVRLSSLFHPRA